jgi:hypothetical protein
MAIDMGRAYRPPMEHQTPKRIEIEMAENGGAVVRCDYGDGERETVKAFESQGALQGFLTETLSGAAPEAPAPEMPAMPAAPATPPPMMAEAEDEPDDADYVEDEDEA